jgi:stage V sporulation protein AC
MEMTKEEYRKLAQKHSPPSPLWKNMLWAFLVGGLICAIGQAFGNMYQSLGLSQLDASTATSMTLIFLGALLTGLNVYDSIAKRAGAGTLVPITGFANSIVSPALEFKSEGYVLGMSAKMFSIAGPVLVFGFSASILYGLILWLFRLF